MEHRHYRRRELVVPLKLWVNKKIKAVTRSMEVSGGGIRIVNPGIHLSKNMIVDIEFPNGSLPGRDGSIVTSMVVHLAGHSTGLVFGNEQSIEKLFALYGKKRVENKVPVIKSFKSKRKTSVIPNIKEDELESVGLGQDV